MLSAVFDADWAVFSFSAEVALNGRCLVGIEFDAGGIQRTGLRAFAAAVALGGIDVLDAGCFINA